MLRVVTDGGARCAGVMRAMVPLLALACATGCELKETAIVDVEDVVVAEVYVELGEGPVARSQVLAFLHRTVGGLGPGFAPVPGARIVIQRGNGDAFEFGETGIETCVSELPAAGTGTCYWLPPAAAERIQPGDALTLHITLADGKVMRSAAVVPGDFGVIGIDNGIDCALPPDTPFEVRWSPSGGTWAYINETAISGLGEAFAARGIEVDEDPLSLLGLSISASDTSIVFPGEFGIFNRFELDQDLATALQKGLPANTWASVTISAAERNYVNWVRGGNFNPSGQVRVPSVRGAGTGVFAATVTRSFRVAVDLVVDGELYEAPACPVN